MKRSWNALFGGRQSEARDGHHVDDQHDIRARAYFLSHTGVPLGAMEGIRQPEPTTGEYALGD